MRVSRWVSAALLFAYNTRLKRSGFWGNVVVGTVTALTIVYGALISGGVGHAWVGFLFAFLLTIAREIVKDIEDIRGDLEADARSLPIEKGITTSATPGPRLYCRNGSAFTASIHAWIRRIVFRKYYSGWNFASGIASTINIDLQLAKH